nr:uroporphyrinogen-III C-methyltransferase [Solimonas marina]
MGKRIDAHDQLVGQLREQIAGGRERFQLVSIEQLLLLANDRLQLARDVPAAVSAIDEADSRLAALKEPRLLPVRQALAQEKAALQAVPLPDYQGAALTLSSLIQRAPHLPLLARAPSRFEAVAQRTDVAADAPWYARAGASIREALSSIFTVRHDTGPSPHLLSAEQETLVVQVLALKLEGARVALLRGDTTSFRDLCESASHWLDTYFQGDDPGVAAAHAELERLQPLDLSPPLPDISRSLGLLRAFMKQPEPASATP